MVLFDSHCHIDDRVFDADRDEVVVRARKKGVRRMMIAGVNLSSARRALCLARRYTGVYAAVGVHPHDTKTCRASTLTDLASLAEHSVVRAWGEIGLDFHRMYAPQADQEKWFVRQIKIADGRRLPIIFHERDSEGRFLEILKSMPNAGRHGVVHCFSGSDADLAAYLDMGLYIGVTGIITMQQRGARLRRQAADIPVDRLLIETDAPYLTPAPCRNHNRRNEPAFVGAVLRKLAEVRGVAAPALARATSANACRLFGIDGRRRGRFDQEKRQWRGVQGTGYKEIKLQITSTK